MKKYMIQYYIFWITKSFFFFKLLYRISVQFRSVTQSCPTPCNPMNGNTPGLPVHHQLLEFTQTHVYWVGDAIQPSHSLLSPSPPTFNLSQHQDLFKWVSSLNQVAKVLEFQLQLQSFQRIGEGEVTQSCPTLCNPMDSSPSGSSIHGVFQTRILEWVAISFSRGSSWPRDRTSVSHIADRLLTNWANRESLAKNIQD